MKDEVLIVLSSYHDRGPDTQIGTLPNPKPYIYRPMHLLWIILPAILTTATIILTVIMGLDETDELLARVHSGSFSVNDPANCHLNILGIVV